jgi:hypothetical protein
MNNDNQTDDEGEIELEIIDDTPEPDRGKPKATDKPTVSSDDDDDLEGYSDKVKKRINKLKYDYHAERRAREDDARLREEAINIAIKLKEERDHMARRLEATEDVSVDQAKQRIGTALEQAKAQFKAAYEAGDGDALTEAQLRMTELKNEEARVNSFRPQRQVQEQPVQQPVQRPVVPRPSMRAEGWAQQNPWFGKDEEMTGYAYGVHERLIKQGVAPDSEEYYNQINTSVRRVFADRFDDGKTEDKTPRRQMSSVVAPAGRQTNSTPRKVVLTSTQVALAKRLGLKPEVYAAQLLKESSNG